MVLLVEVNIQNTTIMQDLYQFDTYAYVILEHFFISQMGIREGRITHTKIENLYLGEFCWLFSFGGKL